MKKETFTTFARTLLAGFAIYCVAYTVQSQMTSFTLPTNNSDSGFKVIREDGTSVFAVDGEGTVTSDEDGLQVALPTNDSASSFEVIRNDGTSTFKVSGDGTVTGDDTGLSVSLPTNNNTSAFEVTKNNGASVFKVNGNGGITGDGSGLSNVRPIANYVGANMDMELTSDEQVVKYVTLTVPSSGVIMIHVSGSIEWKSADKDGCRLSITQYNYLDYSHLIIDTDQGSTATINDYAPVSLSRGYTVNSGGTYRFNLIGNNPTDYSDFSNSQVAIHDVDMTAVYYPTGGVGAGKVALPEEEIDIPPGPGIDTPDM